MAYVYRNNISTTINDSNGVASDDTLITVADGSIFPSPALGTVRATLVQLDSSGNEQAVEIVDITGISGNDLTVTRARESTAALTLANGDLVEMRLTAGMVEDFAQLSLAQTFTGEKTFTETKETVYNLTGTDIDPANGTIQYKTLSANTTFTESLESGQGVRLRIAGGTTYTVTWPTMQWVGGTAPTLTANDEIVIYKEQTTLYGLYVGSVA